jgi:ATP-dependent DNA helicase RecQ
MPAVQSVLRQVWGFESLRPTQDRVVQAALEGRDALAVMPTGGGKSLCYQLPPLLDQSLTVVISPLIALMKDQVDSLLLNDVPAAALHSGMSLEEQQAVERSALEGGLRLLYLSPERALTVGAMRFLKEAAPKRIAIDEAHCISAWGHDFRPEYRRLRELRAALPQAVTHAFTATATPQVREDILCQLGMEGAEQHVGRFDRPNLAYRVIPKVRPKEQAAALISALSGEAAIVYCISRKDTEAMAEHISAAGIRAMAYHAGLAGGQRKEISEAFAQERLDVVCATVAFGMGIDRPNVRLVIHESLPKSIEAYQQETGRAGRDGEASDCVLLYRPSDAARWRRLILEGPDAGHAEVQLRKLDEVRRFAAGVACRHAFLSRYFGQEMAEGCQACDNCLSPKPVVEDAAKTVHRILVTLNDIRRSSPTFGFGVRHAASVLRGSMEAKIVEAGHETLRGHGLLKAESLDQITAWLEQLVDAGLAGLTDGKFPHLFVTEAGQGLLKAKGDAVLRRLPEAEPKEKKSGVGSLSASDQAIFERLRACRRRLAEEAGYPAYVICHDSALRAIAERKPNSIQEFESVPGMGRSRAAKYGMAFLEALQSSAG